SPEHVHTDGVTPLALWNASTAGHDAEQVLEPWSARLRSWPSRPTATRSTTPTPSSPTNAEGSRNDALRRSPGGTRRGGRCRRALPVAGGVGRRVGWEQAPPGSGRVARSRARHRRTGQRLPGAAAVHLQSVGP